MHIMTVTRPSREATLDTLALAALPAGSVIVLGRGSRRETLVISPHWAVRARLALFELTGWHLVSGRSGPRPPARVPGVPRQHWSS